MPAAASSSSSTDDDSAKILRPTKPGKKLLESGAHTREKERESVQRFKRCKCRTGYEPRMEGGREGHGPETAGLTSARSKTGFTRRSKSRSRGELTKKRGKRKKGRKKKEKGGGERDKDAILTNLSGCYRRYFFEITRSVTRYYRREINFYLDLNRARI